MRKILICVALVALCAVGCKKGDPVSSKGFDGKYAVTMNGQYAAKSFVVTLDDDAITGSADGRPVSGYVDRNGTVGFGLVLPNTKLKFKGRAEVAEDGSVTAFGTYQNKRTVCGKWTAAKE